jgi:hypothetical protein
MQKTARLFSTAQKKKKYIVGGLIGASIITFSGFFYFKHLKVEEKSKVTENWVKEYTQSEIKPKEVKSELDLRKEQPQPSDSKIVILENPNSSPNENKVVTIQVTNNEDVDKKQKEILVLKTDIQKNLAEIVELNKKIQALTSNLEDSTKKSSDLTIDIESAQKQIENLKIMVDQMIIIAYEAEVEYVKEIDDLNKKITLLIEEEQQKIDLELKSQKAQLDQVYDEKNFVRTKTLGDVLGKLYAAQNLLIRNLHFVDRSMDLHKLSMTIFSLQDTLQTNAPFMPEISELKELVENDEFSLVVLNKVPDELAMSGVPTVHQLLQDFTKMKREAISLSYAPAQSGFFGRIYSKIISLLIITEKGNVGGTSADSRISRAEYHLQQGSLYDALKELDQVSGLSGEYLRQWKEKANQRLTMDQTVEILKYHLMNSMSKIN